MVAKSKKSRKKTSPLISMFKVMAIFAIWAGAIAAFGAETTRPVSDPVDPVPVNLSTYGIKFTPPPAWKRIDEHDISQFARFVKLRDGKQVGLLEVDMFPAGGFIKPAVMARAVADDKNLLVSKLKDAPDGAVGFDLKNEVFPHTRGAVFSHKAWGVIVRIGTDDSTADDELMAVLKSTSLADFKPVADDLPPLRPVRFAGSKVTIRVPESFRLLEPKNGDEKQRDYKAVDWCDTKDSADLIIQAVPNPQKVPMLETGRQTAARLTEKFKVPTTMPVDAIGDGRLAVYSSKVIATGDSSTGFVLVQLEPDRYACVLFMTPSKKPAVLDRYVGMLKEIAKSAAVDAGPAVQPATTRPDERLRFRGD